MGLRGELPKGIRTSEPQENPGIEQGALCGFRGFRGYLGLLGVYSTQGRLLTRTGTACAGGFG